MYPGSAGLAGPAIYFTPKPEDTHHKAKNTGIILKCEVNLGKVKDVGFNGDYSIDSKQLKQEGYDSVMIPRTAGKEYAVYQSSKIKNISVHQQTETNQHRYSATKD